MRGDLERMIEIHPFYMRGENGPTVFPPLSSPRTIVHGGGGGRCAVGITLKYTK